MHFDLFSIAATSKYWRDCAISRYMNLYMSLLSLSRDLECLHHKTMRGRAISGYI